MTGSAATLARLMMTPTVVTCKGCKRVFDEQPGLLPKPPCPHCGSTAREQRVSLQAVATVDAAKRLTLTRVAISIVHDRPWVALSVVLAVVGAAIGSWVITGVARIGHSTIFHTLDASLLSSRPSTPKRIARGGDNERAVVS